jgi:hypothetical protein
VITLAAPAFLLAGVLAAGVPLALHLVRRRPPHRAPLPTERFLSPDPRTAVRVSRPTDLLLLALRMLLLVLAGAAFARPVWFPAARGTREVVLLDTGAGMGTAWPRAVAAARERVLGADGKPRGVLALFDTLAVPMRRIDERTFATLAAAPPTGAASRYSAALGAIPAAARELRGADSVRVTLITAPRWGGWSDGLAALRRAVWPGAIDLVALPASPSPDSVAPNPAPRRAVRLTGDAGPSIPYARAALEATGWSVRDVSAAGAVSFDSAEMVLVSTPVASTVADAVRRAAEAGATVLVTAPAGASFGDVLPWRGRTARAGRCGSRPATGWVAPRFACREMRRRARPPSRGGTTGGRRPRPGASGAAASCSRRRTWSGRR